MTTKDQFHNFAETMIDNLNIDDVQKEIIKNMLGGAIENMEDSTLKEIEDKLQKGIKIEKESSVFD